MPKVSTYHKLVKKRKGNPFFQMYKNEYLFGVRYQIRMHSPMQKRTKKKSEFHPQPSNNVIQIKVEITQEIVSCKNLLKSHFIPCSSSLLVQSTKIAFWLYSKLVKKSPSTTGWSFFFSCFLWKKLHLLNSNKEPFKYYVCKDELGVAKCWCEQKKNLCEHRKKNKVKFYTPDNFFRCNSQGYS